MTEYVYKIPDNLMCNLPLHNSHLPTHTYIQKTSILTTFIIQGGSNMTGTVYTCLQV